MEANPTLDQLQVFLAVASTGSFSAASRALNRAQSVISYTIANLEAQLEVTLFEREGVRQPKLTEEGKVMLEDARRIVADLQVMRARARGLKQGLEAEVSVAVSTMIPDAAMIDVLKHFQEQFPSVSLRLNSGELGMVRDMVATGQATIGIGGAMLNPDDSIVFEKVGHAFLLPVAAPGHRLAMLNRPLTLADVRDEVQLVVTDASGLTGSKQFNVLSYKIWRVSDIATKHSLIVGGLGWGGLPAAVLKEDLASGKLVHLELDAYEQGEYPIYAMNRASEPLGPASSWMVDAFRDRLGKCPGIDKFKGNLRQATGIVHPLAAE